MAGSIDFTFQGSNTNILYTYFALDKQGYLKDKKEVGV